MSRIFSPWLVRTGLGAVVAFLVLTGVRVPAAADVSYLTLTSPATINAPCPVTLTFNGSIVGPPNSSVTYVYSNFVNGGSIQSPQVTTTIPQSGTRFLPSRQLVVDKAHAGFQDYQLFIYSPSGSDSDTHGKVYFTVNCQIYTPPSPLPIPTNLQATNDVNACDQFAPPLFCNAALGTGQMAFSWHWQGDKTYPDVDGFKLYDVPPSNPNGNPNSLVVMAGATFTFANPPAGGFNGHCYEVSAYKGGSESLRSEPKCIGNVALSQTRTFTNVLARVSQESGGQLPGTEAQGTKPIALDVGHEYRTWKSVLGDNNQNVAYRTGVFVPLDFLHGHTVHKAVLRMHVNSAITGSNYQTTNTSCAWEIGMGTGQWWTNGDWINGDFSNAVSTGGEFPATSVAFDITHLVQMIAGGAPNNGFVLKGREENMNAFTEQSCETGYENPVIDVTFI